MTRQILTFEGAQAVDLSVGDPLMHLVFTKGAALLEESFYRTQVAEIQSYAQALVGAERHEPGFAWKFAAYMRDPARGKGNRIQGSVAPAILAAAFPESPFVEEYVYRCLRHRPDDVTLFVAHGKNLGLAVPSDAARRGMARALAEFDDYQILKYAKKDVRVGKQKTLRLVDAMGLCKAHLDPRLTKLYAWLLAPTRARAALAADIPILAARHRFFHGSNDPQDFAAARLTHEQARSFLGNELDTWQRLFDVPGLVGDMAFLRNVRSMHAAGVPIRTLVPDARKRRFVGVWPHQVYAGYRAAMEGTAQRSPYNGRHAWSADPMPAIVPVFESVLERVASEVMPQELSLGIADVSGSMYSAQLGGMKSSTKVGDVACLFAGMMARTLGYAATFSDKISLVEARNKSVFEIADALKQTGLMGGTQVAGSVLHLMAILAAEPKRPRPRTLYFFSDMQFAPPEKQTLRNYQASAYRGLPPLDPDKPPLLAVIGAWRELFGPIDVVLWNLAAYDASPTPSNIDHVMMLAGFDANSFRHVATWQAAGGHAGAAKSTTPKDPRVELAAIRTF